MKSLAGTGELVRLILRRDRILLPVWILLLALLVVGQAAGNAALYDTPEVRQAFVEESNNNPVTLGMLGPIFDSSLGGIIAWRVGVSGMLFAGIPSLLLLLRHTRTEEVSGRRELLGSTVVGRHAPLTAALIVMCGANLVLAATIAAELIAFGLPTAGSLALGFSFAAAGWIFAAVASVAAQATEGTGAARGTSLVVFATFLLLRVVGDVGGERGSLSWLSWASPLGWTRLTRPFADERWWVFALVLGLFAVLVAVAYALSARRDLGAGFLPTRPGPASAAPVLRSPLALAWRLQKGTLLGWTAGFALIGGLLGAVAQTASELLDTSQLGTFLAATGASNAGEAFMAFIIYILSLFASAYAIMAGLRLRSEEVDGRADPVLTTPVSRLRWASSHLFFAVAGPIVLLGALGLGAGLAYGVATGDVAGELPGVLGSAMAKLPAVWVVSALAATAYGLLPRFATVASWAVLGVFLLLELGWELQQVSDPIFGISPFAHVHPFAGEVSAVTVAWLVGVAAVLTAAGLIGFQHRDVG